MKGVWCLWRTCIIKLRSSLLLPFENLSHVFTYLGRRDVKVMFPFWDISELPNLLNLFLTMDWIEIRVFIHKMCKSWVWLLIWDGAIKPAGEKRHGLIDAVQCLPFCLQVAIALEKAALSDEYFVKRKLYPNVDFYSGLIYR